VGTLSFAIAFLANEFANYWGFLKTGTGCDAKRERNGFGSF